MSNEFPKRDGHPDASKPTCHDKSKLLNQIEQGLMEIKTIHEGKAKFYAIADLFRNN